MKQHKSQSGLIKLCVSLLLTGSLLLSGSVWAAGASQPPQETLRFLPQKPLAVMHLNDINSSIGEVMSLITRLGFGYPAQRSVYKLWKSFHRGVKTESIPKSWNDFFLQFGLTIHPNATFAAIIDSHTIWKGQKYGFLMIAPISSKKRMLRVIRDAYKGALRARLRLCYTLCRSAEARIRLKGATGPMTLKQLTYANKEFAHKCPILMNQFQKSGKITCSPPFKVRQKLLEAAKHRVQITKVKAGTIYQYKGADIPFGFYKNYVVFGSSFQAIKNAFTQFQKQKRHPLATTFAKRNLGQTHMQTYLSGAGYSALQKLQTVIQKMVSGKRARQLATRNSMLLKLQKILQSKKMYRAMWAEIHSNPTGYKTTMKFKLQTRLSPSYKLLAKVKPTVLQTLRWVPKNAWLVSSTNYVGAYVGIAKQLMRKMGGALGPFRPIVAPWLNILGNEATIAIAPGKQGVLRLVLALSLKKPSLLQKQIKRLENALGGALLFNATSINGIKVRHKYFKPKMTVKRPFTMASQVSFAVLGKTLLIAGEMTPKPNLMMMQELINSNGKGSSIHQAPTFHHIMQKAGTTNMFLYLSFPRLLQNIKPYFPPKPQIKQIMKKLQILHYIFVHGRNQIKQNAQAGYGKLAIFPAQKRK